VKLVDDENWLKEPVAKRLSVVREIFTIDRAVEMITQPHTRDDDA